MQQREPECPETDLSALSPGPLGNLAQPQQSQPWLVPTTAMSWTRTGHMRPTADGRMNELMCVITQAWCLTVQGRKPTSATHQLYNLRTQA